MTPAYGYCRYSSNNQREESIEAQKRAIRYYASEKGYQIIKFYEDKALTGKTANRPAFMQMMADIKAGEVQAVLVHKLDRFSRDVADSYKYEDILKDHGVKLVSVMEALDDSPTGILMRSIITAINAFYSNNLAAETMKGLKENAYKCMTTGGTPALGYNLIDKQYVINEREAEAVRLAFQMYAEGYGYLPIIYQLRALGHKTKLGKNFGKNSLHDLFRNPKYKGTYTYNRAQKRRRDGSRTGKSKPDDQIIRVEGGIPAIVSTELWDRVNDRMDRQRRLSGAAKAKQLYLLSGLVVCGECGAALCGNSRRPARDRDILITYRCSNRQNKALCANREIKRDSLESFVLTQLEQHFFRDDVIPILTQQLNAYLNATNADAINQSERLKSRQTELDQEKANIIDAIAKTGLQDTFTERLTAIEQEITHISAQIKYSNKALTSPAITEDMVKSYLGSFREFVKRRDIPQIKAFIDSYVEKAEVFQTHVKLTLKVAFLEGSSHSLDSYTFDVNTSRRQLKERTTA
ncbi:MAG: recombinase family protein [Oscillospiraceae bacterium]|nr:recombinase family protein [Oscillospiraceae bacterium]